LRQIKRNAVHGRTERYLRLKGWGVLWLKMAAGLVSILYSREASTVGSNIMRTFGAVCFSLLLSAVPATASDQNLKEEIGKIGSAYEQHFNKKDAAGITSLFAKNYLRVTQDGVVADNTKYYEDAFKAGLNHLEVKMTEVQSLSENMALATGESQVTGKSEKGDPIDLTVIWTALDVRENGQWKIRMLTSVPKPPPPPQTAAAK
jgi:ketosteroid isomerase-like protein